MKVGIFFTTLNFAFNLPIRHIKRIWRTRSSEAYISYLKRKGLSIGSGCILRDARTTAIDLTRPSLVEIGSNVDMNANFTILTHDYVTGVFLHKHHKFINSSGKVKLGNNIYFGKNCTVLKGVTIGDNVVVGANSLVISDIPANSVAVGSPARVVSNIDDYLKKREQQSLEEAFEYARSIKERYCRRPAIEDFFEEFPLFVNGSDAHLYPTLPIKKQLGDAYEIWIKNHNAIFPDFDAFLKAAGI